MSHVLVKPTSLVQWWSEGGTLNTDIWQCRRSLLSLRCYHFLKSLRFLYILFSEEICLHDHSFFFYLFTLCLSSPHFYKILRNLL